MYVLLGRKDWTGGGRVQGGRGWAWGGAASWAMGGGGLYLSCFKNEKIYKKSAEIAAAGAVEWSDMYSLAVRGNLLGPTQSPRAGERPAALRGTAGKASGGVHTCSAWAVASCTAGRTSPCVEHRLLRNAFCCRAYAVAAVAGKPLGIQGGGERSDGTWKQSVSRRQRSQPPALKLARANDIPHVSQYTDHKRD